MTYNLTAISENSTGIASLLQNVNSVLLHGTMGIMILIGICTVLFLGFYFGIQDTKKSVAATSIIAFGLSIFLRALDLLPNLALFITLILTGLSIAFASRD